MRWQFPVAVLLALGGLVAALAPRFLAEGEPRFVSWIVGIPLLVGAAVIFEWGWVRAKQDERER